MGRFGLSDVWCGRQVDSRKNGAGGSVYGACGQGESGDRRPGASARGGWGHGGRVLRSRVGGLGSGEGEVCGRGCEVVLGTKTCEAVCAGDVAVVECEREATREVARGEFNGPA